LYAKDGMVWMNRNQLAELFDTSVQNIGQHISNILKEKEVFENSGKSSTFFGKGYFNLSDDFAGNTHDPCNFKLDEGLFTPCRD
jgi:hypothetical protein